MLSGATEWEGVEPGFSQRNTGKGQKMMDMYCSKRNFDQIQGKSIRDKMTEHWNRLPISVVVCPSLDTLKTELDVALSNFF